MSKENSKNSLKHKKRKSEDLQKEDNNDDQNCGPQLQGITKWFKVHILEIAILLMALSEAKEPLSTTQLSEIISKKVKETYSGFLLHWRTL